MSREILFRAWHKKRKKYYEVLHLHIDEFEGNWATCKGFSVVEQKDIHIQVQPEECIIEQYTGLKDKNGTKIFEGDVLLFEGETKRFIESGKECKNPWWHKDVIAFSNGCFTSSIISQHNSYWGEIPEKPSNIFFKDMSVGEVIGNIHEDN